MLLAAQRICIYFAFRKKISCRKEFCVLFPMICDTSAHKESYDQQTKNIPGIFESKTLLPRNKRSFSERKNTGKSEISYHRVEKGKQLQNLTKVIAKINIFVLK